MCANLVSKMNSENRETNAIIYKECWCSSIVCSNEE